MSGASQSESGREDLARVAVGLSRPGFELRVDLAWDSDVMVLFGASGSGKTSLLECVLGLHPAARCRIRLAGEWLEDADAGLRLPVSERRLGWLPQEALLFPHLNVRENLRFGIARAGRDGESALARAIEILEIGHLLTRSIRGLSGGERSRVALARAIASGPRTLLLDEPLSALDLPLRARVLPYLLRVRDELGLPMLYITHDPDEAILLGGTIAVLDAGRVVAQGSAEEVLWSQKVLPLSESLGIENVIQARTSSGEDSTPVCARSAAGLVWQLPWEAEPGVEISLGLRAQDVLLATAPPGPISARNVFPGHIRRLERHEGSVFVHVDTGEAIVAKLTPAAVGRLQLQVGSPVHVIVKAQALRRLG